MRYTCNKKAYPDLEKDCKKCSEYIPCAKGGKWCFIAALENSKMTADTVQPIMETAAAPVLRDTSTVTINFGDGTTVDVLREDVKKQLEDSFYRSMGLGLWGA